MFGRPQACRQHEIPTGLAHFIRWSKGALGTLSSIASERTIMGEWRPYFSRSRWAEILLMLEGGQEAHVRIAMGVTACGAGGEAVPSILPRLC